MLNKAEYSLELSLILGLSKCYGHTDNEDRTRVYTSLADAVERELSRLPRLTREEIDSGMRRVKEFEVGGFKRV